MSLVIAFLPNAPLVLDADLTYDNLIIESYDQAVLPQAAQQLTIGQFAEFRAMGTLTQILAPIAVDGVVDIRSGAVRLGATAALNSTGVLRGVGSLDVSVDQIKLGLSRALNCGTGRNGMRTA